MFTECPECQTTFRLSAEDLRRAQGKVRCGECGAVFNALESLAEDVTAENVDAEVSTATGANAGVPAPDPNWLTNSAANPPGELEPDLDAYEAEAYTSDTDSELADDSTVVADGDGDDDDSSPLDSEPAADAAPGFAEDPYNTADPAPAADADTAGDVDDTADDTDDGAEPVVYEFDEDDDDSGIIVYLEPDEPEQDDAIEQAATAADADAASTDDEDDAPDFDESIWERIPGVGAGTDAADDADTVTALQDDSAPAAFGPDSGEDDVIDDGNDEDNDAANSADPVERTADADEEADSSAADADDAADWLSEDSATESAAGHDAGDDWQPEDDDSADNNSPLWLTSEPGSRAAADDTDNDNADEYAAADDPSEIEADDSADAPQASDDSTGELDDQTESVNDGLEFDVPAEKWNSFFGPTPAGSEPGVWRPPDLAEAEAANDDSDAVEASEEDQAAAEELDEAADGTPAWLGAAPAATATEEPASRRGLLLVAGLVLALLFTTQLVHYNRDQLAAHPSYGATVREAYAALGQTLYPAWPLSNSYEIRGSEAVAGESGQDVLDIRAQIAAVGEYPTGLPRLRVVLRDRWSNPVAASDFSPSDYAAAADLPADGLLRPGTVIPAHVSILDPGSGAQGFELELCLPRRDIGLECTDQPFK